MLESTVFKAPTKWLLKGSYLYASFRFPVIRFDAPTLLSFSGCTHAHAKCPPVNAVAVTQLACLLKEKKVNDKTSGGQGHVVNKSCKDERILVSCSVFGSLLADGSYARRPCFRLLEKLVHVA